MNGLWFIVFGFTALMIISGVGAIVSHVKETRHYNQYKKLFDKRFGYDIYDPRAKEERMHKHKYYIWEKWFLGFMTTFLISAATWFVLLLVSIFAPMGARKEVSYFKHQKSYVETAVVNGSDLENMAITQVIVEQNEWLARAKSRLDTFGRFSKYYNSGLEDVTPIIIER